MQSQVRFNMVAEKVLEKVPGPWCKAKSDSTGSGEGCGEGLGGRARLVSTGFRRSSGEGSGKSQTRFRRKFLVQSQVSCGEGSGEGLGGFGARPGSTGFRRRFPEKVWEALVQSEVRFNRVPEQVLEKVPEKVPEGFGGEPGQVQRGSGEGTGEGSGRSWCKAGPGSTRRQVGSDGILGVCRCSFSVKFQQILDDKICENEFLLLLGIPSKLFF